MPYNTEGDIADFVNTVYEDAMLVARDNNVMGGLVTGFGDRTGLALRKNAKYGTIAFQQVNDYDDLSSQAFTPSVDQTLTPYEYGAQVFLTDARLETDIWQARQDASQELGASYGQKVDKFLVGLFSSLTGGTAGSAATGNMTWSWFYQALTLMRRAIAPQPWICVLSPEQWGCLGTSVAPGQTVTNSPFIQDEIVRQFFVGRVGGVDIFTSANIGTGTSVYGGMFSRNAIALDMRRPFRIEPERDASRRGWELNASSVFAYGVWRPQYGVAINSAGTAPTA